MKKILLFWLLTVFLTFTALSQVQIYSNSFESIGDFYTDTSNSIWEQGTPQKSVIDTAYSGQGIWITDLDSAYQGVQNSYLYSPQIVIAPFDSGYISFWQFVDLDTSLLSGKDICSISYRKGADTNWLSLGYQGFAGASNWFNANSAGTMGWHYDSSGWFNSSFPFYRNHSGSYFYQVDTVQFRFTFRSYANHSAAGWAIDDFGVFGWNMPVDLGIMDIVLPNDSTITGDQTPVRLKLKNFGLSTINTAQCSIFLDNSPSLTQTFTFSNGLLPDSIVEVNFSNTYMAPNTNYTLTAIAKINNDNVIQNDTLRKIIVSKPAQFDVEVFSINNINYGCRNSQDTLYFEIADNSVYSEIVVSLFNAGYDTIKDITFSYSINNSTSTTELWHGIILPLDTIKYTYKKVVQGYLGIITIQAKAIIQGETYIKNNKYAHNFLSIWCYEISIKSISKNEKSIIVRPNPAHSFISIDFNDKNSYTEAILTIYNMLGEEVRQYQVPKLTNSINIDISTLPPGIYYIQLKSDNQTLSSGKFIKQ